MSKEWVILHLSDFHIDNPEGEDEPLREGFYQRHISGFCRALNAHPDTRNKPIDAIVITGDFVNGGINEANFAHAEKVIQFLCQKFVIAQNKVYTCNGNHDIDRMLDKQKDSVGARRLYNTFASKFGNGSGTDDAKRFFLTSVGGGMHVLSIDSTLNAYGESRPGDISVKEMDNICEAIKKQEIGNVDLLIVASHHPVYAFQSPLGPNPEPNMEDEWKKKHLWSNASRLASWLNQNMRNPILWLSGDIHVTNLAQVEIIHAVVTGYFGTSTKFSPTPTKRHGRLISINSQGVFKSWICQSEPRSYVDDQENERWIVYGDDHPHTLIRKHDDDLCTTHQTQECKESRPEAVSPKILPYKPCVLSELLQGQIIETVKSKRLYHLGRYKTSDCTATLAWIPIGDLMNSGDMFQHIVSAMAHHLNDFLIGAEKGNSIIVGVDSWGAILASQLSVITGLQNFCIAGRAEGSTHTPSEKIDKELQDKITELEHVILVSDVIGTGSTLNYVHNNLCKRLSGNQGLKWTVLSVICDEEHDRKATLGFATSNMTACKDLRMPILSKDKLPDDDILPTDISLLRQFPLS